ncbi:hypothetical protein ACFSQQ_40770 [Mesorhizobium kowhaii]|uniref:hypothetical protein n=1 Tax=Mesorhizobium kowhaii TaxID=1300272 RepID=UPI0035E62E16
MSHWRTRPDPLEPFWPRVEELLKIEGIIAVTILDTKAMGVKFGRKPKLPQEQRREALARLAAGEARGP